MSLIKYNLLLVMLLIFPSLFASAQDIPEVLKTIGFTKYLLLDYEKEEEVEYFTFSDWTTIVSGDIITFIVVNGRVTDWIKEEAEENVKSILDI